MAKAKKKNPSTPDYLPPAELAKRIGKPRSWVLTAAFCGLIRWRARHHHVYFCVADAERLTPLEVLEALNRQPKHLREIPDDWPPEFMAPDRLDGRKTESGQ